MISPDARKEFIDTGGMSAVRGIRALVSDMSSAPRVPTMVEPDAFEVGKDLACPPGAVVARTEVFELIQYKPTTPTVYQYPLLMIPPMINKYYITDLAPGRSMLEFFVAQGYQVFVASWRNPERRHRDWDLDTYGLAVTEALSAIQDHQGPQGEPHGSVRRRHSLIDGLRASERDRATRSGQQPQLGRSGTGSVECGHDSRTDGPEHRRHVYPRLPHPRLHGRAHARRGVRLAPAR
jgi:hypothetical protein